MSKPSLNFDSFDRIWLLTWTTYATWLPGDRRGFVSPKYDGTVAEKRNNQVGTIVDSDRFALQQSTKAKVIGKPVLLTKPQATVLKHQFEETAQFRGWTIISAAIMSNLCTFWLAFQTIQIHPRFSEISRVTRVGH